MADFVLPDPETLCEPGLTVATLASLVDASNVPPPVCDAVNV
jgi:hypothetical protein